MEAPSLGNTTMKKCWKQVQCNCYSHLPTINVSKACVLHEVDPSNKVNADNKVTLVFHAAARTARLLAFPCSGVMLGLILVQHTIKPFIEN